MTTARRMLVGHVRQQKRVPHSAHPIVDGAQDHHPLYQPQIRHTCNGSEDRNPFIWQKVDGSDPTRLTNFMVSTGMDAAPAILNARRPMRGCWTARWMTFAISSMTSGLSSRHVGVASSGCCNMNGKPSKTLMPTWIPTRPAGSS